MNTRDWKKRIAELLREHPAVHEKFTGQIEINMSEGGITRIYTVETSGQKGGSIQTTTRQELK